MLFKNDFFQDTPIPQFISNTSNNSAYDADKIKEEKIA